MLKRGNRMFEETQSDNSDSPVAGEMPTVPTVDPLVIDDSSITEDDSKDIAIIAESNDVTTLQKLLAQKDAHIKRVNAEAAERRISKREADAKLVAAQKTMADKELAWASDKTKLQADLAERLKTDMEKTALIRSEAEQAKKEAQEARINAWRVKAGVVHRLPDVLTDRLNGTTQAEIEADAARIAESLPQRTITNDGGSGNRTPIDSAVEAMKKRREQIKGSYKM